MTMQRCECEALGKAPASMAGEYDPVTEWPFTQHRPGKCKCRNNIRLFRRADGSQAWLCSICFLMSDRLLDQ